MLKGDGIMGLYNGLSASVLRQVRQLSHIDFCIEGRVKVSEDNFSLHFYYRTIS